MTLMLAYREMLDEILRGVYPDPQSSHDLTFKNSFGSVAGYVDGNIFCSCGQFGFALKLPRDVVQRLLSEEGATPLKYFPKGHVKKDYAVLPPRLLDDTETLQDLIAASVAFVTGRG